MHDDGVIKFTCTWQQSLPLSCPELEVLICWRDRLFNEGFIGVYPNGIGYGNISLRLAERAFLVSGTQTGHLQQTDAFHFTKADGWNIEQNSLHCVGPVKASSESLTHAALYDYSPDVQAVIHGHHPELWQKYQHQLPTTRASVPYGTPEMAHEMWRLFREENLTQHQVLIMAGHDHGVLAFGKTLKEAAQILICLT